MGKRSGLLIAIAALVMSVAIWGNSIATFVTAFSFAAPPVGQSPAADSSLERPDLTLNLDIDAARLMAHVEAIALPRSTAAEKVVARSYLTATLAGYGLAPIQQRYGSPSKEGINIIAEISGSDPSAGAVVLGAHYDTPPDSPGADDNGSAIATLLEAARIFSSQAMPATLKLVFFDQEEQQADGSGLLGSAAFTANADNRVGVTSAVILDMVGYACRTDGCQTYPLRLPIQDLPATGEFLAVLGIKAHSEPLNAFVLAAASNWPQVLSLPIPKPTLNLFPDLLRSDHAPFWEKDIPTAFVTDTANFRNPYYHTAQDTPDTLDPAFFQGSAQHIVRAIALLLSQP